MQNLDINLYREGGMHVNLSVPIPRASYLHYISLGLEIFYERIYTGKIK